MEQARKKSRFHYPTEQIIEKPFNWKQMMRLFTFIKPYAKTLLPKTILMMLLATAVRLAVPIFIGVFAVGQLENGTATGSDMLLYAGIVLILYILSYVANIFRIRWMNRLGQFVIFDIRKKLFDHIQHLSHRFFDQRSAGSILVRVINDVNSLQDLFTNGVINLLMDIVMLVGIVAILFYLSPELAILILVILPIMFFISTKLRRKIRRAWQTVRLRQSRLNSHLNESIQGIRVTQAYAQEHENMEFFDEVNTQNYESWREATKQNALFRPFVEMASALVEQSFGTSFLIQSDASNLTLGVFVSFAFYIGMFWEPISRLGQVYNQLLVGMASSERIFEFLDEEPNVVDKKDAKPLTNVKGELVFKNVEFSYDDKRKALNNINLKFDAGTTVALVGHTGSGKSTIVNLMSRFYDPTSGDVMLDGVNLRDIRIDDLRKNVSYVLQDTFIFAGTIMENIRFGNPHATDEDIIEAAKAIGAHSFIEKLDNGYQTEVEEQGAILSVGERQLLSFARALLADPRILILDEATASIDTETELKIQEGLKTLLAGRTAIMIAHRLSTIRDSDNIIVLEQGNVMEQGTHDQLIDQKGIYFGLVKSQFSAIKE
ncbi:LOW QUALITY PROTEIN: lipid A export ATP-binding/permease protein MsbA [Bacillus sp. JCM 19046]|nr:LOW QUALITY PROTEIN: lipid A export ATP-binding/permease protein MsbA [Bacillus sp. JCM 19045]GAF18625.1 LOW QUALITY PROTEIN: lipid A export ATP-binding/permease protein MsbA [Bacillus sp. JCM 19046]